MMAKNFNAYQVLLGYDISKNDGVGTNSYQLDSPLTNILKYNFLATYATYSGFREISCMMSDLVSSG